MTVVYDGSTQGPTGFMQTGRARIEYSLERTGMVYMSRLIGILITAVILTAPSWAVPQDGDATVRIGPIRWTKDSIGEFAVPDAVNVLFLASKPDSAILVVDPKTGAERQRLRGYVQDQTSVKCSPDGTLCLVGNGTIDGRRVTLLYNDEGQLLREWDESSEAWAVSAKLQRACVLMKNGDVAGCALRDLTTGETIKWLDGWEYVWFDEWHNKLYVGTGKWGGEFGRWTVELDATTGQELHKWGLATYGPMCRLKDSDTLLVFGEDLQRSGFKQAKMIALDVKNASRIAVVDCFEGVSDACLCIQWVMREARLTLNADGTRIMLHQVRSNIDESIVARRFGKGQSSASECYLSDRIMLFGQTIPWIPEFVDDVNERYYYRPGMRYGFICRAIGPTLPVPDPGTPTPLMLVVDGSTLRIASPTNAAGEGVLSITDISGKLVQRSNVYLDGRPVSVSIAGLPTGSYLCSLQAGSVAATGKFAVVR